MTQEEKQLLLKALCARLPYGVKCSYYHAKYIGTLMNIFDATTDEFGGIYPLITVFDDTYHKVDLSDMKPYFRPMSSMTEEEEKEYNEIVGYKGEDDDGWTICDNIHTKWGIWIPGITKLVDWLNAHHFDYRGLIEKGLALEAPKGMYK